MKQITGKSLARTLRQHGWQLMRIHGSHHVFGKNGSDVRLSVPIHGSTPLKIGLAKHLLKLAGLTEKDV
ncbi:MAG: type II toxin-antitoxin system HicA family toxin [Sideroxyarcus sp.]|nr:type II toxin-antitoxin system HicA family toxin [Sideroxyarcus sp.]